MDDSDDGAQAMYTPVSHSRTPGNIDSVKHHIMDGPDDDAQPFSTPASYPRTSKRASSDELALDWVAPPPAKRACVNNIRVVLPAQAYPRSLYKESYNLSQRHDQNTERWALPRLLVSLLPQLFSAGRVMPDYSQTEYRFNKSAFTTPTDDDYPIIELHDFTIYLDNLGMHANEMRPLNELGTRRGDASYLCDGTLRYGNSEHRVQAVPFRTVSLDGYGTDAATISDKIWIQSPHAEANNAWYVLKRPSKEYARYHIPFLWLADFTKHFVDYLDAADDLRNLKLQHFRAGAEFHQWLQAKYSHHRSYLAWQRMYGRTDYCSVIANNYDFLWKEATSVQEENRICYLWKEVDAKEGGLTAVPPQPEKEANTVVTPYIYDCFEKMYFGRVMECRQPVPAVHKEMVRRKRAFQARVDMCEALEGDAQSPDLSSTRPRRILVGDVIQLNKDQETRWKSTADSWYAYVQSVEKRKGEDVLGLIWLYHPHDTICGRMMYPHKRELFFSDHCNCGDGHTYASDVLRKVNIKFAASQRGEFDFFIRQSYITDEESPAHASFVTFCRSQLQCRCKQRQESVNYTKGQTVLISGFTRNLLEPVILTNVDGPRVKAVRLLRRARDLGEPHAKANELVVTDEELVLLQGQIRRPCHIRCFAAGDTVTAPYSYNGTGDCWILTGRLIGGSIESINTNNRPNMIEGFDPYSLFDRETLRGLSLFCGGGSFDRGFEESGAVKFTHSVDYAKEAIHTNRANAVNPDALELFYGNVNDFLARGLGGDISSCIPQVGKIGLITAGSPCVAFSRLQPDAMSEGSLRNASLVAVLLSTVDLYRPEYGVFENVFAMADDRGVDGDENVLSQMICALVGMGYQVQVLNEDAHTDGSGQQRSRLLLCIAAPGLTPLPPLASTHAHPSNVDRKIGKGTNGVAFGRRTFDITPFPCTTARDTIGDLPDIGDAMVNMCIPYPDHRVSSSKGWQAISRMKHIPRFPAGRNWKSAVAMGYMPQGLIDGVKRQSKVWQSDNNKAYGRVFPQKLLPTIITHITPDCAFNGRALHYDQPRVLTIMEARRAQSYPDHEVLIGQPAAQWRIVGNSVDRRVAVAAGVSLREAWLANDDYQQFVDDYILNPEAEALLQPIDKSALADLTSATASATMRPVALTTTTRPLPVVTTVLTTPMVTVPTQQEDTEDELGDASLVQETTAASASTKKSDVCIAPIAASKEDDDDLIIVQPRSGSGKPRWLVDLTKGIKPAQLARQSLPAKLSFERHTTRDSTDELGESSSGIRQHKARPAVSEKTKLRGRPSLPVIDNSARPATSITARHSPADYQDTQRPPPEESALAPLPSDRSEPFSLLFSPNLDRHPSALQRFQTAVAASSLPAQAQAPVSAPASARPPQPVPQPARAAEPALRQLSVRPSTPTHIPAFAAGRITAVRTSGFLSPPDSEPQSPAFLEPDAPLQQDSQNDAEAFTSFASISQQAGSPRGSVQEENDDELSRHVDAALANTSDDLGVELEVGARDVRDVLREQQVEAARRALTQESDDSEWMDYELTG